MEGAPSGEDVLAIDWWHTHLFLGPLAEKYDLGIVVTGTEWDGFRIAAIDPEAPRWDEITPATGRTQILLWDLNSAEYLIRPTPFRGSLLVEMLDEETVRVEWSGSGRMSTFGHPSRICCKAGLPSPTAAATEEPRIHIKE